MSAGASRHSWYQPVIDRFRPASPAVQTAVLLGLVMLCAIALQFLLPAAPGFSHDEASVAMAAQRVERGHVPIYFHQGTETIEPAFVHLVAITGRVAGWGIDGPRLAAALAGLLSVAGCTLWYLRTLGPLWGTIGGLLMATSFWHLVHSHQAAPQILMPAVAGFGLYALHQAITKPVSRGRFRTPSAWYGVAGLLFGIGFYIDVTMRAILPVVLVIGTMLYLGRSGNRPAADRRGLVMGLLVMLLVIAPLASWFWQNPDVFRLGINAPGNPQEFLRATWDTLSALLRQGTAERSLLTPILAAWFLIGLSVVMRRPLRRTDALALAWLGGFLLAAILITPGDHGQLLVLMPVMIWIPLRAMQTLTRHQMRGMPGWLLPAFVAASLAGSIIWSVAGYIQWTGDPATYKAFAGDIRDAVEALAELPPDDRLVYFATGEQGRIVRYLADERPRRDIQQPDILVLPATGTAWLVLPASAGIPDSLTSFIADETLASTIAGPDDDIAARIWLMDDRTRERLPFAVPPIRFENGPTLLGYEIMAAPDEAGNPAAEIVQVYQVEPGAEDIQSLARLVGIEGAVSGPDGPWVHPAPDRITTSPEIVLTWVTLPFPGEFTLIADLQTAIRDADGEFLVHSRQDPDETEDPFAYLNTIGYIGPEQ